VRDARAVVPSYGSGRAIQSRAIDKLLTASGMKVLRADLADIPVDVWPRFQGVVRIFIDNQVGPQLLRYIKLHEVAHALAGEAEEPERFRFTGPLPESEPVADLFALLGVLDEAETDQGAAFVEERVRELVPLDDVGWQRFRIPWLAPEVCVVRQLLKEETDA
jgi:hypothetical protein